MELVDLVARSGQQTPAASEAHLRREVENNHPDWCGCPLNTAISKDYVDVIGGKKLQFTYKTSEKNADVRVRGSWQFQEAVLEPHKRIRCGASNCACIVNYPQIAGNDPHIYNRAFKLTGKPLLNISPYKVNGKLFRLGGPAETAKSGRKCRFVQY